MKKLLAFLFLIGNVAVAEQVCKDVCEGVSDKQKACVMKTSCEPKLKKLQRENAKLKKDLTQAEQDFVAVHEELIKRHAVKVVQKNHIELLVGYGPLGTISEDKDGSDTIFRTKRGLILGGAYSRSLTEHVSLGLQLQTNGTGLIPLGYHW